MKDLILEQINSILLLAFRSHSEDYYNLRDEISKIYDSERDNLKKTFYVDKNCSLVKKNSKYIKNKITIVGRKNNAEKMLLLIEGKIDFTSPCVTVRPLSADYESTEFAPGGNDIYIIL